MIYLSYFAKYKGSNGVSVSIGTPSWFNGDKCIELAPSWELVKGYKSGRITKKEYRKAYIKQLKALNVHEYYKLLNTRVLLCYEKPEDFCHRHIIREWFVRNGYLCEELDRPEEPTLITHTCTWCKYSTTELYTVCRKTGEILKEPSRTDCSDWRYTL